MKPLFFFYGTLLDVEVLSGVAGRPIAPGQMKPAKIEGYRRYRVAGKRFPAIVEEPSGVVEGVLVEGLGRREIARIMFFENDGYDLQKVKAILPGGSKRTAWTFMATPRMTLSDEIWAFADWRRTARIFYLRRVRRWAQTTYRRTDGFQARRLGRRWPAFKSIFAER